MKAVEVRESKAPGPMLLLVPSVISLGVGGWLLVMLLFGAHAKPGPEEFMPEVGKLFGWLFLGLTGVTLLSGIAGLIFVARTWLRQRGERP